MLLVGAVSSTSRVVVEFCFGESGCFSSDEVEMDVMARGCSAMSFLTSWLGLGFSGVGSAMMVGRRRTEGRSKVVLSRVLNSK